MNNTTPDTIRLARDLMREAPSATLATIQAEGGGPYASWVLTACADDGAPLLYLSDLAVHAQNLAHDSRASLLFLEQSTNEMTPASSRVSVLGSLTISDATDLVARYMNMHKSAKPTEAFADFHLYRMEIDCAHLIAGFGKIVTLAGADMTGDIARR